MGQVFCEIVKSYGKDFGYEHKSSELIIRLDKTLELNRRLWNRTEDFGTDHKTLELNIKLWKRTEDFGAEQKTLEANRRLWN